MKYYRKLTDTGYKYAQVREVPNEELKEYLKEIPIISESHYSSKKSEYEEIPEPQLIPYTDIEIFRMYHALISINGSVLSHTQGYGKAKEKIKEIEGYLNDIVDITEKWRYSNKQGYIDPVKDYLYKKYPNKNKKENKKNDISGCKCDKVWASEISFTTADELEDMRISYRRKLKKAKKEYTEILEYIDQYLNESEQKPKEKDNELTFGEFPPYVGTGKTYHEYYFSARQKELDRIKDRIAEMDNLNNEQPKNDE